MQKTKSENKKRKGRDKKDKGAKKAGRVRGWQKSGGENKEKREKAKGENKHQNTV